MKQAVKSVKVGCLGMEVTTKTGSSSDSYDEDSLEKINFRSDLVLPVNENNA